MAGDQFAPHWTLDKRVPVALIIAILVQTAGFAFWMGQLSQRVESVEMQLVRSADSGSRLTRLETRLTAINDSLSRLERGLEKLADN